jgi:hypothetical protein
LKKTRERAIFRSSKTDLMAKELAAKDGLEALNKEHVHARIE